MCWFTGTFGMHQTFQMHVPSLPGLATKTEPRLVMRLMVNNSLKLHTIPLGRWWLLDAFLFRAEGEFQICMVRLVGA